MTLASFGNYMFQDGHVSGSPLVSVNGDVTVPPMGNYCTTPTLPLCRPIGTQCERDNVWVNTEKG